VFGTRRFTRGFPLNANYTLAKNISDSQDTSGYLIQDNDPALDITTASVGRVSSTMFLPSRTVEVGIRFGG
jgi:hypothetical protein